MRISQLVFFTFTVVSSISVPVQARAQNWTFDSSLLNGNVSEHDIYLLNTGSQLPGSYKVDVLLNGEHVDYRDITFKLVGDSLKPCLTKHQLFKYGIKTDDYPEITSTDSCVSIEKIPGFNEDFNFTQQQLLLTVPQAELRHKYDDLAPQDLWDDGVPAFLMNYQASINKSIISQDGADNNESRYMLLEPGLNLGAWRLRNSTNWQSGSGQQGQWKTAYTYLERGLYGLKSRLTLGDRYTSSDIFDSVPFLGVMLASDENMVPFSQRSFSPVVRGVARTQARVEIKQNNYTIYDATVPPGPFTLDNLPKTGSGGDLQVTVHEADGGVQVFSVPYQTPALALHEGYLKYGLMAGQYHPSYSAAQHTSVAQASVIYGLPWNMTIYGGMQGAEYYHAISAGFGASLGAWGSISLDTTATHGQPRGQQVKNGGARRLRYNKSFDETRTNFALSYYQYTSSGYSTLSDVLDTYQNKNEYFHDDEYYGKRKSRTTMTLSQSLGDFGYINLSDSRANYSGGHGNTDSFSASYSFRLKSASCSINWSHNKQLINNKWQNDRLINLTVSMPLEPWLGGNTRTTWQMSSPSQGGSTQQIGLNGMSFDRQLNWSVSQLHRSSSHAQDNSMMQLGWNGRYGQLNGNYGYSRLSKQMGLNAAGGILVTRDGLTLGQPLDDTVALIEAPGAAGVPVGGYPGVSTDFRGYTILSGIQPYIENTVSLDSTHLPADADVTQTDVKVIPTQGAVIPASYRTHIGSRGLINLTLPNGKPVNFGALAVLDGSGEPSSGIVGESGQVYLSGLKPTGDLLVKWGASKNQQCQANYHLPDRVGPAGLYIASALCE